jgi:uncharacterized membrane protein YhaH (DUF805 family)
MRLFILLKSLISLQPADNDSMTKRPPTAEPVNFFEAVRYGFEYAFQFKGTASRSEFWYWTLFYILVNVSIYLAAYAEFITAKQFFVLTLGFNVLILVPTISLWFRRGNDTKFSSTLPTLVLTLSILALTFQSIITGISIHETIVSQMTPAERCANLSNDTNNLGSIYQATAWYNNLSPEQECYANTTKDIYDPESLSGQKMGQALFQTVANLFNFAATALIIVLGAARPFDKRKLT